MDGNNIQSENNNQTGGNPSREETTRPAPETGRRFPDESRPRWLVPMAGLVLAAVILSGTESAVNSLVGRSAAVREIAAEGPASVLTGLRNRLSDVKNGYDELTVRLSAKTGKLKDGLGRSVDDAATGFNRRKNLTVAYAANLSLGLNRLTKVTAGRIQTGAKNTANLYYSAAGKTKYQSLALLQEVEDKLSALKKELPQIIQLLTDNLYYYSGVVADNWLAFISGEEKVVQTIDEAALRESLKAEILAELGAELEAVLKDIDRTEPTLIKNNAGQGIVVVPNDDSRTKDQIRTEIQSMFSDEIAVQFDPSGQSGIITPVFRGITGENYIFVLTPISR